MSVDDYRQAGFLMSPYISQAIIDRAERDVMQAYIEPIDEDADTESEGIGRETLMQLTYTLCLQRSIFATRSGAKEKQTAQSQQADRWAVLSECAATSIMKLDLLAASAGVKNWQRVIVDICGLMYKTQYFSM